MAAGIYTFAERRELADASRPGSLPDLADEAYGGTGWTGAAR